MKSFLQSITDRVSTKKGMWVTLGIWLAVTMLLAVFAPSAKEYEVSNIQTVPDDAQSVIAQGKVDHYFKDNEGIPAILVFQAENGEKMDVLQLVGIVQQIEEAEIEGVDQVVPLSKLPPQAVAGFFSKDQTTAILPITIDSALENKEIQDVEKAIHKVVKDNSDLTLYVTGPAGIATDTLDLFSRADVVLILSTVGLILVLLIVIYRSPLLALIPLLTAGFVYEVVMQTLGLMGKAGLVLSSQTLSIMTILLFAALIDYSLFVFSRFREELKKHDDKFEAMKLAMREVGTPVFYSGGTVLAAMLVLFFAQFGDYRNFAPTFATTMLIIMLASVTLVPAMFALFGRKSFWPMIPKVGQTAIKSNSFWSRVGRFVAAKPGLSVVIVGLVLLLSASNMVNLKYEFDTMKSFPKDMPSRMGYEILEDKFEKGDLAPTTVLYEGSEPLTAEQQESLKNKLAEQDLVGSVRVNAVADEGKVVQYSLTFAENPYSAKAMDALESMRDRSNKLADGASVDGKLYFAGETATKVDDRSINDRDLIVIVALETLLIFVMLISLTRSIRMSIYMIGTILISFLAALGLGMFLSNLFFDIDTISNRVPLYSFVFLIALGIDYNIMLISRYQEERAKHSVKEAVEIAVASTGGVISSAGLILAATFAVLMTQPIQLLFVFGFIVAIGILLDTFLVRGVLLPGLIVLFEGKKEKTTGTVRG
ncbi:MMPL family transporter [Neobacillus niacini]|uniref:MMPL family transporter n=1 Tax=Neobacillus niacini TaxID=86668 RepID=UPI0021CB576F|nr:MMPL family transporter [Neobacillus niacini]MCM3764952.1 MMPL family transporter [Neobacillus niacini]